MKKPAPFLFFTSFSEKKVGIRAAFFMVLSVRRRKRRRLKTG